MNEQLISKQSSYDDTKAGAINQADSLLLCSIDGLRPDALQTADTPAIDGLIATGAICWQARSVIPSVTLPAHVSMMYGVDVPRHSVTDNVFIPINPPVPSLLDVAHAADLKVGTFINWEPMRDLSSPGSLDVSYYINQRQQTPDDNDDDDRVTQAAIEHLRMMSLDLVFVYLGNLDNQGHKHSWMSSEYLAALETADRCLGRLVATIAEMGRADSTVVMAVTDHGGHDHTHGLDCDEDMIIPWVLAGPGIKRGYEIQKEVRIFDTCPTAAYLLGLDPAPEWEGRVVTDALEDH